MTKKLGLTQRVISVEHYDERRDSLDQRWWSLVTALESTPIPLANLPTTEAMHYADALDLSALIITGGNSIATFDPTQADIAPERDAFELTLIEWAIKKQIPIVGICRGMQMLNYSFGGNLVPVSGHRAIRHPLTFKNQWKNLPAREVNSYHQWGMYAHDLAPPLQATAEHADGSIEAFIHPQKKIAGIMWHPEREQPLIPADIELLKGLLS